MRWVYVLMCVLLIPSAFAFSAQSLDRQEFVNDQANILTPEQELSLTTMLIQLEQNTTLEFAVVTAGNVTDVFDASYQAAQYLGVGKQDVDNGLLLFIAPDSRRYFIQVGLGLEGVLPDARVNQVAETMLVPAFQEGNYAQGIQDTLLVLAAYAAQDETAISQYETQYGAPQGNTQHIINLIIMFIVFAMILTGRLGILPFFFFPMGPTRGGSFGRGGFGGFGGGGFGGGGAGGGW